MGEGESITPSVGDVIMQQLNNSVNTVGKIIDPTSYYSQNFSYNDWAQQKLKEISQQDKFANDTERVKVVDYVEQTSPQIENALRRRQEFEQSTEYQRNLQAYNDKKAAEAQAAADALAAARASFKAPYGWENYDYDQYVAQQKQYQNQTDYFWTVLGIDTFNGELSSAKSKLNSDLVAIDASKNRTEAKINYDIFLADLPTYEKLINIDPLSEEGKKLYPDVVHHGIVQPSVTQGGGSAEAQRYALNNQIAQASQTESVLGNMIAGIVASGGRVSAEQMQDLANAGTQVDTGIRSLNLLNAVQNYQNSPSDNSYTKFITAYKDLANQPDYSAGISLPSSGLMGRSSALSAFTPDTQMRSLSSIDLDTPLFSGVATKEAIENGLANAKTNREQLFWLSEADRLRENEIHKSAEYGSWTADVGKKLDLPFAQNPYSLSGDIALSQEQQTRGLKGLSITSLPSINNYNSQISLNQAELLRQVKDHGIFVYGSMPDGSPKANWIAQAYAGPAGGKFINPSDVLPNVPIQDYSQYLKSINVGNLDKQSTRVSALPMDFSGGSLVGNVVGVSQSSNSTIPALPIGGFGLTAAMQAAASNRQTQPLTMNEKLGIISQPLTNIALGAFGGHVGQAVKTSGDVANFTNRYFPSIFPKEKFDVPNVDNQTANSTDYRMYKKGAEMYNEGSTVANIPAQGLIFGSAVLSAPKSLLNMVSGFTGSLPSQKEGMEYENINKSYSNSLSGYNQNLTAYNELLGFQAGIIQAAKATGKIDPKTGVFVYDPSNARDLKIVSAMDDIDNKLQKSYDSLSKEEMGLKSQYDALSASENKIKSAQKNEDYYSLGGMGNRLNMAVSASTTKGIFPNISGISENPLAQKIVGNAVASTPNRLIPGLGMVTSRLTPDVFKNSAGAATIGIGEGAYNWVREKPVDVLSTYGIGKAFPLAEYGASRLLAGGANSEIPLISKIAQKASGSPIMADVYSGSTMLVLPGLYAADVYGKVMGDNTTDNSISGRSKRLGENAAQFGVFMKGMKSVTLPAVENPYLYRELDRPSEKARIFLSSRLNAIGMEPGQRTAYLENINPYKNTRYIQPAKTTEEPDLSHLSKVRGDAGAIKKTMIETPHSLMGSGVVEAQASDLPTGKLLRGGKDADLYTEPQNFVQRLAQNIGGILEKSPSPRAEAPQVRKGKNVVAVDPHEFPNNYPDVPGRKYGTEPGSYNEDVKGLGSILFGEPVKGIPRPEEITIAGKTPKYEGEINFEHLNVQSAKKSEALMKDLSSPVERGYRLEKDLYDSISIKNDLIAVERSRGVTPAREKQLLAAEKSNKKILDQTITYQAKTGGELKTEKLGDLYKRTEKEVIASKQPAYDPMAGGKINFVAPEPPSIGVIGKMGKISGAGGILYPIEKPARTTPKTDISVKINDYVGTKSVYERPPTSIKENPVSSKISDITSSFTGRISPFKNTGVSSRISRPTNSEISLASIGNPSKLSIPSYPKSAVSSPSGITPKIKSVSVPTSPIKKPSPSPSPRTYSPPISTVTYKAPSPSSARSRSPSSSPYNWDYSYTSPSPSSPSSSPMSEMPRYPKPPVFSGTFLAPPGFGGGGGGGGGSGRAGVIKNPLVGLNVASLRTAAVFSRGMGKISNTGSGMNNLVTTKIQRGSASPVIRVNPSPNRGIMRPQNSQRFAINTPSARQASRQPAPVNMNFDMGGLFGNSKKKRKGGMVF